MERLAPLGRIRLVPVPTSDDTYRFPKPVSKRRPEAMFTLRTTPLWFSKHAADFVFWIYRLCTVFAAKMSSLDR